MMDYSFSTTARPSAKALMELFQQTTWAADRDLESVEALLNSDLVYVAVYQGEQLLGFGRAVTDGLYRALLDDIVIDVNHRVSGLGRQVVERLVGMLKDVDQIFLNTRPELEDFYVKCGFSKPKGITMKMENLSS